MISDEVIMFMFRKLRKSEAAGKKLTFQQISDKIFDRYGERWPDYMLEKVHRKYEDEKRFQDI